MSLAVQKYKNMSLAVQKYKNMSLAVYKNKYQQYNIKYVISSIEV